MKSGFSLKSIVVSATSLLTIIGSFLPWAVVSFMGISQSVNGLGGSTGVGDGIFFLIGGIIIAVLALIGLKKEDLHIGLKIAISLISAVLLIIAIFKIVDVTKVPMTSAGIGLYLLVVSDIATAVLPWLPIKKMLGAK